MGLRKHKRLYPKLSVFFRAFNVNVDRLLSLSTEEKEPVSMVTEDFGHESKLSALTSRFKKCGLTAIQNPNQCVIRYSLVATRHH